MNVLYLGLDDALQLNTAIGEPPSLLEYRGRYFREVVPDDSVPLFYDWIKDDTGNLCGLELHLWNEHPLSVALRRKPYVTFEPFPRVLFRPVASAQPCGLEAFDDLWLLAANHDSWLIVVGLDHWLTQRERDQIVKHALR